MRTRNAGAAPAAIGEASRGASENLSQTNAGIQTRNADLQQKQRQAGLSGLQDLYKENVGAGEGALGLSNTSLQDAGNLKNFWQDLLMQGVKAVGEVAAAGRVTMSTATAQLDPETLRDLAIRLNQTQQPPSPAVAAPLQVPEQKPDLSLVPSAPSPAVSTLGGKKMGNFAPQGTIAGDKQERERRLATGAGVDQISGMIQGSGLGQAHPLAGKILGGLAQGVAKLGDVGLSAVAPALAINLPGTEYHHMAGLHELNKQIGAEEGEQKNEAQTAETQANTAHLGAETAQIPENAEAKKDAADASLAQHGLKRVTGEDGSESIVPDENSPVFQHQQLALELTKSTLDLRQAQAEFAQMKGDPIAS